MNKDKLSDSHKLIYIVRRFTQCYWRLRLLKRITNLSEDSRILDFGGGPGVFSNFMQELSYKNVSNYDPSPKSATQAKQFIPAFKHYTNIDDFKKIKFNIITSYFVHAYMDNKSSVYSQLADNLEVGGKLIIEINNNNSILNKLFKDTNDSWNIKKNDIPRSLKLKKIYRGSIDWCIYEYERNGVLKNIIKNIVSVVLRFFGSTQSVVHVYEKI